MARTLFLVLVLKPRTALDLDGDRDPGVEKYLIHTRILVLKTVIGQNEEI